MPIVDFTNVKGLEPLPDMKVLGRVVHAEDGLSKQQQPKTEMRWEVIAPEEYAGRQVFDILSFHPDAMFRTKQALVAMGFDETYQGEINADELLNREAVLYLTTEQSTQTDEDGNAYPPRNKIKRFKKASTYQASGNEDALAGLKLS